MFTKLSLMTRLVLVCGIGAALLSQTARPARAAGVPLQLPFDGYYRVTSWFDHFGPDYSKNGPMTIYNGETNGDCNPPSVWGYCYDGHSGTDYATPMYTPIKAAADGTVYAYADSGLQAYGRHVYIQHADGRITLYGHLDSWTVSYVGQPVSAGQVIGYSGNTGNSSGAHLHFGVYLDSTLLDWAGHVTDPYGWQGSYPDPLEQTYDVAAATCLWRSQPFDPVHCADVIVEDGGVGYATSAGWSLSTQGNSYQLHYRTNDNQTSGDAHAIWAPSWVHGYCTISVYVPAAPSVPPWLPTSQHVVYTINSYQGGYRTSVTVNQAAFANAWVQIWSDKFLGADYPIVSILGTNTGEPVNTKFIVADAMRFTCYSAYVPIVL
jgi:murein DD-endopeptidase MepM/ murein hydrolase activator NlpD